MGDPQSRSGAAADPQLLRKLLRDSDEAAQQRESDETAERARTRAEIEGCANATRLCDLLTDADWTMPPSARRCARAALTYFANPEILPAASRTAPGPVLVDAIAHDLQDEIDAFQSFDHYRERMAGRRMNPGLRVRRLYERRKRLRAALQTRR
jgi:hypothetical protein